jgi:RNA polymerase sigma-70 factor (ECF subfamily)
VARNVRRNAARKFQRADDYVKSQRPSSVTPSAEDLVIADEGVRVALGAMSETDREVLLLAVWDGRSVEDIATILGITSNAAAVRLTRAKDRFRRHFDHAMVG